VVLFQAWHKRSSVMQCWGVFGGVTSVVGALFRVVEIRRKPSIFLVLR